MNINEKLASVQQHLKAPKGQFNGFGKYMYRSCEDILEAVKPHLGACTITINDEIVMVGDRIYVKATATFSDGEHNIQSSAFAREASQKKGMDESQVTGSASSYARKYALNGLLLIDDTKDADTRQNKSELEEAIEANKASIDAIKNGIQSGDLSTASEAWFELDESIKKALWVAPSKGGPFTTQEREVMKSSEFRLANAA